MIAARTMQLDIPFTTDFSLAANSLIPHIFYFLYLATIVEQVFFYQDFISLPANVLAFWISYANQSLFLWHFISIS
jgi:hypothetical protein